MTVTVTLTETIFNIPVTSHIVWATCQAAKGPHPQVTVNGARATNTNAAFTVKGHQHQ